MTSVMDPQSIPFTPRDDIWRFHSEMLRVQQTQAEHSDRLSRLERRQDEDARVKSVWGTSSPFPSVLGGTPQQGANSPISSPRQHAERFPVPLQQPNPDAFSNFDDQSSNLIGSLHLDPEEEPRRLGATSRANSVRFDETANQGHWSHASRVSMDLIPRTGSSLGGHPMTERSYSHKSDGRQSSAAASVHSATSGRANSLGIDTTFPGDASTLDVPRIAPGLFFLGSVPAIIRCWLNTSFRHDSLLYAAVCTGSYTSCLDMKLVEKLGYEGQMMRDDEGTRKIKLDLYLPEAVPYPASSRASSPTPQLPSLKVEFTVVESVGADSKAIKIFLGSDLLRHHSADILFSSNSLLLFDDERNKLSVPLVRPEDESTFKTLQTSTQEQRTPFAQDFDAAPGSSRPSEDKRSPRALEGLKQASPAPASHTNERNATVTFSEDESTIPDRRSFERNAPNRTEHGKDGHNDSDHGAAASSVSRSNSSSSAIWGNWRRIESEKTDSSTADWASLGRNSHQGPGSGGGGGGGGSVSRNTYQRRDTGIKVLKPIRTQSRNASVASGAGASSNAAGGGPQSATSTPTTTAGGGSRFFDEGRRRVTSVSSAAGAGWGQVKDGGGGGGGGDQPSPLQSGGGGPKRAISVSEVVKGGTGGAGNAKDASAGSGKPGSSAATAAAGGGRQNQNPVGGASAFAWLNSAGGPGGAGTGAGAGK